MSSRSWLRGSLLAPCALALAATLAAAQPPPPAAAPAPPPTEAERAQRLEQARRLYEQGQIHYDLAEYGPAIAKFREAYALSTAPMLLFNIAQAHRLKGECTLALEVYRHFVRLDPTSPRRPDAEGHIRALESECAGPPPPDADALAELSMELERANDTGAAERAVVAERTALLDRAAADADAYEFRRRLTLGALVAAAVTGVAAGGLYLWNDGRYDRWSEEDRQLGAATGDPAAHVARQIENDDLLASVRRMDRVSLGLAIASAACLVSAAIVPLLPVGHAELAAGPGDLRLAWTITWR